MSRRVQMRSVAMMVMRTRARRPERARSEQNGRNRTHVGLRPCCMSLMGQRRDRQPDSSDAKENGGPRSLPQVMDL